MTDTALRTDDLTIPQGTTYKIQWPITDTTGQPVPLDGYTARSQARRNITDQDLIAEWTTDNGGITLAESTLTLNIEPAESTDWDWTFAYYDVELVSTDGSVTRITQGVIRVDPEITR